MNSINLIGRVTKDLTLEKSGNGNSYINFTLAVDDFFNGEKQTQFINCVSFGKTAENIAINVVKGQQLGVEGKLTVKYDKEKNTTYVSVPVHKITFIGNKDAHPVQQRSTYTPPLNNYGYELEQDKQEKPTINGSILWED